MVSASTVLWSIPFEQELISYLCRWSTPIPFAGVHRRRCSRKQCQVGSWRFSRCGRGCSVTMRRPTGWALPFSCPVSCHCCVKAPMYPWFALHSIPYHLKCIWFAGCPKICNCWSAMYPVRCLKTSATTSLETGFAMQETGTSAGIGIGAHPSLCGSAKTEKNRCLQLDFGSQYFDNCTGQHCNITHCRCVLAA